LKLLFDTSVWVDHLRRDSLATIIPRIRGKFFLWMDSVVAAELAAGCRNRTERRTIAGLLAAFERAGRMASPEHPDFLRAATAISRLREKGQALRSPGAALLDGLIAAVASRQGALLVTLDEADFRKLATHIPLRFESLDDFVKHL
jgi:predicted nucleic acid-binding protein